MNKLNKILTERFSNLILRFRYWIIVIVVLLTLFFSFFIGKLTINPDVFSNLPKDDRVAALFNKIGKEYGGNAQCIVAIESENIFSKATLEHIRQITDSLKMTEGVSFVTSLTNIIDIRGSEWGIEVTQLIDEYDIPEDQAKLDSLKRYVLSKEFYKGALISEDGKMTVIAARISGNAKETEVSKQIKTRVMSLGLPEKIYFGGQPFIVSAFADVISKDILILGPLAVITIVLILLLSLRSFYGFFLPVLNVMIGALWTFGFMALLNIPLSIITSVIPILLVAVGSAYTIHLINRFRETMTDNYQDSLGKALSFIAVPVFYTAITDIFGFLSFAFGSYLDMINKFGLFTSFGIACALILSLTFTPAVMSVLPSRRLGKKAAQLQNSTIDKFLRKISLIGFKKPGMVIITWLVFAVVSLTGVFSIERNVDLLSFLSKKNQNRKTEQILQEKMGGTSPVYVLIKSRNVLSPEILRIADSIESKMLSYKEVVHTQSLTGLFKQMNEVMGDGYKIPENQAKTDNLWFMIEGQDILENYINFDHTEMLIHATYGSNEMKKMAAFTNEMERFFDGFRKKNTEVEMTGWPPLMLRLDENIVKSQMSSLLLAFSLIFISISLLSGSVKRGFYAITPIILTLMILFGIMGWLKIPLDFATVLVGSICIGIGIDYSIHISNHFKICKLEGKSAEESIEEVISTSGKAILINILSITSGFLILIFSSLVPLQRFGILLSVTMICSGLAAITFLPALLLLRDFRVNNHFKNKAKNSY